MNLICNTTSQSYYNNRKGKKANWETQVKRTDRKVDNQFDTNLRLEGNVPNGNKLY